FPSKKRHKHIEANILAILINDNDYNNVLNNMVGLFDEIRTFRNNSVHSGLRYFDINEKKLDLYNDTLKYCKFKCLEAVEHALVIKKIKTLEELKNNMWDVFNEIADTGYITGTVAFTLSKYF
ncbi:TPA: hypothetical protein OOF45_003796, partial [Morganella morganii]|nr:hypothetical protein [Morganella morganii]